MAANRVKLIKNPNYVRDGLKSYAHLLRKYNITPTLEGPFTVVDHVVEGLGEHLLSRFGFHHKHHRIHQRVLVRRDETGSVGRVSAEDVQNDSQYLAPVSVGTPEQVFNLDFDTGSADLWLWSTLLPYDTQAAGAQANHNIFDPSKSSTWKDSPGQTWQITYGDGSGANGKVGTDSVGIGGLTIKNQSVEIASSMSDQFVQGMGDGLCGLAFDTINCVQPAAVKTPVDNMALQSDISPSSQLFTAYLGSWKDASDPDQGMSFYTFGHIDQDAVNGQQINYTPVDATNGFWQFPSTSAIINGTSIPLSDNTAIADTGTTLALIDDVTCKAIYAAIPGSQYDSTQQGYLYPASTPEDALPVVQFAIGNTMLTMQKEHLSFADAGNGMVYGSCQSRGNMPWSIFGDAVLQNMYCIFDQGNTQFGWVPRTQPQQNLAASPSSQQNQATVAPIKHDVVAAPSSVPAVPAVLPTQPNAAVDPPIKHDAVPTPSTAPIVPTAPTAPTVPTAPAAPVAPVAPVAPTPAPPVSPAAPVAPPTQTPATAPAAPAPPAAGSPAEPTPAATSSPAAPTAAPPAPAAPPA